MKCAFVDFVGACESARRMCVSVSSIFRKYEFNSSAYSLTFLPEMLKHGMEYEGNTGSALLV